MGRKLYTLDRVVRLLITLIIIIAIIYFINFVKVALLPFLIAWLAAYFINPAVEFVRVKMRVKNKLISIIIVLLAIVGFLTGFVMLSIPSINHQIEVVINAVNSKLLGNDITNAMPVWMQDYLQDNLTFKNVMAELRNYNLTEIINRIVTWIWGVVAGSFNIVIGIVASFVVLLYMVFILLDYEKISLGSIKLIPPRYRKAVSLISNDLSTSMNRYFRGQALVALLVGILFAIGYSIMGLPLGFALGLFIGFLNLVPYLQLLGIVPMAFLCVVMSVETGTSFLALFVIALGIMLVVQIIQDTLIVPRVMGKVTGLNPAIILLALSIWGALLGVVGMIIALPMTTLLLSYYQRFIIDGEQLVENEE